MPAPALAASALAVPPLAASAEARGDRRRRIMDAAASLIMAQGYGATSMDAVARDAGVSKATLYAHFGAKAQLFMAIVAEECARHDASQNGGAGHGFGIAAVPEALHAMGHAYLTLLFSDNAIAMYRVVMAEAHRFPELGHAFFESGPRKIFAGFAEWARARQAEAALDPAALPDAMAEHFFALLRTSGFLRRLMALPPAPDAAAIHAMVGGAVHVFMRAYATPRTDG
jgi:TetR/AcrR family transcriptional regulator, mexJK operon transcriptional repressor